MGYLTEGADPCKHCGSTEQYVYYVKARDTWRKLCHACMKARARKSYELHRPEPTKRPAKPQWTFEDVLAERWRKAAELPEPKAKAPKQPRVSSKLMELEAYMQQEPESPEERIQRDLDASMRAATKALEGRREWT